jgi:CubicO group peptidase (beta-lactamase class C family)
MRKIGLLIPCLLYGFMLSAQERTLPSFVSDSLVNYIKRGITEWKIPGLAIAIVKDGEVVYMKGFGVTSIGGTDSVNENTLFMIGANTKAFTATTLAILQEEKFVSLDDKVQKWMPEFKLKNSFASKEISITDLLSHRTGFETFQDNFTFWKSNLTRKEIIHKMALMDAPYGLRTQWGYSNAAYVAAGELIPRITGKSWEETVKTKILVPLKMNRTLMLSEEFKKDSNIALPHTLVNDRVTTIPVIDIDNLAPAGSMSSSVKDMAVWLQVQLDNGTIDGEKVIPDKAIFAIRKPYSIVDLDTRDDQRSHFQLYGLGLVIYDRNEKLVYSHEGGVDGFLSEVLFVPEESLGVVVLTNLDQNLFFEDLTNEIRDAFLHLPYQDYCDNSLNSYKIRKVQLTHKDNYLKNLVKLNRMPALPFEAYDGTYRNEVYGDIEIKQEDNSLVIHFSHHPDLTGKLEYLKNNSYLCTYSDVTLGIAEIPFKIDHGKVTGLTLSVSETVDPSTYEFIKIGSSQ